MKNSPGRRRDFRVKMWGASSPDDKLTGDLGNVIEATQISGRQSDRLMAGEKPADLPVQQTTKVELFINLKTAFFALLALKVKNV